VIQVEIENGGSSPLDGFSFVVPASAVKIDSEQIMSIPATGQTAKQQTVPGGVKININFDKPLDAGTDWNGRIDLTAEKWAVKEGSNYSIDIPVEAPEAIVSGKDTPMSVPPDAEIRSQVFLPKGVTATSVEPSVDVTSKKPAYKKLLQFDHVVLTWFQLHIGDIIKVQGSFSDVLMQIVSTDEKWRELKTQINNAKAQGVDVSEAETHLKNAEDYNINQALQSFWKNDNKVAFEYVGYANDELKLAESSLAAAGRTEIPPEKTESKKTPAIGLAGAIAMLLISFMARKK